MVKKSESGAVTGLQITTEKEAVQLEGEYEIREFFVPAGPDHHGKRWKHRDWGKPSAKLLFSVEGK